MKCPYCGTKLIDVGCYKLDCPNEDCVAETALEAGQWQDIKKRMEDDNG
jgi:hypothetical protein